MGFCVLCCCVGCVGIRPSLHQLDPTSNVAEVPCFELQSRGIHSRKLCKREQACGAQTAAIPSAIMHAVWMQAQCGCSPYLVLLLAPLVGFVLTNDKGIIQSCII